MEDRVMGRVGLVETVRLLVEREISARELVDETLAAIDNMEPALQAWEAVDRGRAVHEAEHADKALDSGRPLGPLHGVPVGVKDIFATAGLRTSMGSRIFRDHVPARDATAVARLRGAGAIVIGKTVSTEFAMGDPPRTLNPWNSKHTPGGSSSGSAVAVAAGQVPLALGTQTGGSVIRPAAYNGVVGYKPTYGMVSRGGVFPLSWTLDTVGWMTRSVRDAALALDVLAGHDPADPGSVEASYSPAVGVMETGRGRLRLGIVSGDIERRTSAEGQAHFFEVIETLRLAGHAVELFDLPMSYFATREARLVINHSEAAAVHGKIHQKRAAEYSPSARSVIEAGLLIPSAAYVQSQRLRRLFRQDIDESMIAVDALIMPAAPGPAPADLSTTGDTSFYTPWSLAGLPAITIPSGMSRSGLPLGVQMVGKGFSDATLLRAAAEVERVLEFDPGMPPVRST